jgi:hypothetical protein
VIMITASRLSGAGRRSVTAVSDSLSHGDPGPAAVTGRRDKSQCDSDSDHDGTSSRNTGTVTELSTATVSRHRN